MVRRREFLRFLGAGAGSLVFSPLASAGHEAPPAGGINFTPVKGPMPVETDRVPPGEQASLYGRYTVADDILLPEGFDYQILAAWGDAVGDSRFGYNNDYLSFVETGPDRGFLTVNFEYISPQAWIPAFQSVIGKRLPFEEVQAALAKAPGNKINAYAMAEGDPLKAKIREICRESLIDLGLGVISIRKTSDGKWVRTNSSVDRRITGLSGLDDNRYLKSTGPARAVFLKTRGQGFMDNLGERIIGSFANCAGGTTPWGTVLSGEENIQFQVADPVYADGTSFDPGETAFSITAASMNGQANVFGLSGNKYGWIVELDPANPRDYGTKHTWLGRFRHEAVGVRVVRGRPLAFYSGCDRTGGHIYKFVSRDRVINPRAKTNSRLLENGMLYAAKFSPGGRGRWIALAPSTPVDPDLPSTVAGNMLTLPRRPEGGFFRAENDADVKRFKERFKTLADLYTGGAIEKQGAILIDAHNAASAAGATCTARPEDTEIAPNGSLYISFTTGTPGSDGGPDTRVFKGPKGETAHEYGFVMKLTEERNDPAAVSFRWEMMAMGGEPSSGGAGFANPDNLSIDSRGNVWVVTDLATEKQNRPAPSRRDGQGNPVSQVALSGLFGNNSMWVVPASGDAYLFGIGPMESELTGPFFTPDETTLFLAVQHPGEANGIRRDGASRTADYSMKTTDGRDFIQKREVPLGSNWPEKQANAPPKPAVVAIRRRDRQKITS